MTQYNVRLQRLPDHAPRKLVLYIEDSHGLLSNIVASTPEDLIELARKIKEHAESLKSNNQN